MFDDFDDDTREERRRGSRLYWLQPDPEPVPGLWEPDKDVPAEPVPSLAARAAHRLRRLARTAGMFLAYPAVRADRDRLSQVAGARLTRIRLLESQLRMHGFEPWVGE